MLLLTLSLVKYIHLLILNLSMLSFKSIQSPPGTEHQTFQIFKKHFRYMHAHIHPHTYNNKIKHIKYKHIETGKRANERYERTPNQTENS